MKSYTSEEEDLEDEYVDKQENNEHEDNNEFIPNRPSRTSFPKTLYFSVATMLSPESIEHREKVFSLNNVIREGINTIEYMI